MSQRRVHQQLRRSTLLRTGQSHCRLCNIFYPRLTAHPVQCIGRHHLAKYFMDILLGEGSLDAPNSSTLRYRPLGILCYLLDQEGIAPV